MIWGPNLPACTAGKADPQDLHQKACPAKAGGRNGVLRIEGLPIIGERANCGRFIGEKKFPEVVLLE